MMRNIAYIFSLAFVFVIPLEKLVLISGIGSLAKIVGFVSLLSWLLSIAERGEIRRLQLFHMVVFLFVLWSTASIFWTYDSNATTERILTWFQLTLLIILIWDLHDTPSRLNAGLQAYVLGAFMVACGTIYSLLNATEFIYGRYSAAGLHAVNLGLILALGMPLAWYLAIPRDDDPTFIRRSKMLYLLYLPVAGIGIALTGSRGAMVAALPTVFFVLGSLRRLHPFARMLFLIIVILGVLVAVSLVPQSLFDRMATIYAEFTEQGDLTGRTVIWGEAIKAFMEHPIIGIGSNAHRGVIERGQVAHNSFLSVLVELGIIGFAMFLSIFVIAIYKIAQQPRLEAWLWLTVLASWTLGASALTFEHHKPTWLFLTYMVAGASYTANGGRRT